MSEGFDYSINKITNRFEDEKETVAIITPSQAPSLEVAIKSLKEILYDLERLLNND